MRKIFLFMNVTLDGFFEAPGHDLSWSHRDYEAFSPAESAETDTMLFGHRTYDMMKSFWPTPQAAQMAPEVAKFMNEKQKLVASHKPFEPGWQNVTVISGDVAGQIRQLKAQPGKNIIIMGSNELCVSLLQAGLLDEIQLVVNPVVIGEGTALFAGLPQRAALRLKSTREFKSGAVMLTYEPER